MLLSLKDFHLNSYFHSHSLFTGQIFYPEKADEGNEQHRFCSNNKTPIKSIEPFVLVPSFTHLSYFFVRQQINKEVKFDMINVISLLS